MLTYADVCPDAARARDIAAAGAVAEGARVCATLEELLGEGSLVIILNLTPVALHASVSRACLEAGKHVWSEKPLAETVRVLTYADVC